mmetsp:Transcript_24678/g.23671  ORF Transcript_24678/g.23671 Transcript_24678/m.23671 type:complete len:211 (+) Transcript_24678:86-718(+)
MAHPHPTFLAVDAPIFKSEEEEKKFIEIRLVTSYIRTPGTHGCQLTEILPGIWTAHYNDIKDPEIFQKLTQIVSPIGLVVNAAIAYNQCPTGPGYYGEGIEVLLIDLFDDPEEGELHTAAGDAKQYFKLVNSKIKETLSDGKSVILHCMASLSRSVVLIIAYLMEHKSLSALEATKFLKNRWDATWPNDRFVLDLLEFESELEKEGHYLP